MFFSKMHVQDPNHSAAILRAYRVLGSSARFSQVTGSYAFATQTGVRMFASALAESIPDWQRATKRWLVSIDYGHTELEALELLASIPRSEVRIPHARALLVSNLQPKPCFHPKTLILTCPGDPAVLGLAVGSANLTASALTCGYEHAVTSFWRGALTLSQTADRECALEAAQQFEAIFADADEFTSQLAGDYALLRKMHRSDVEEPDVTEAKIMEAPAEFPLWKSAEVAYARNFWVDIKYVVPNLRRGVLGNQVELQRGSRVFFGLGAAKVPRNTLLGSVMIVHGDTVTECHMRFGDNSMDKLNLPVPSEVGTATYEYSTLLFTREDSGVFRIQVGTAGEIGTWKARSRKAKTLYAMRGGREFGVF
jgi:HKD family nuclease